MSVKAITLSFVAAAALLAQPVFAQVPAAGAAGATGASVAGVSAATAALVGSAVIVVVGNNAQSTGTR